MANLTTTVHAPQGPVLTIPGRISKQVAVNEAREFLRSEVARAQGYLDEFENWTTTCERGSTRAKTFEEM